jgi:hypothetical protein
MALALSGFESVVSTHYADYLLYLLDSGSNADVEVS